MIRNRIVGAFVFPESWKDLARFRALVTSLREFGVNAIMTESDTYQPQALDAVHDLGLRFYAGVACFSDHAKGFQEIKRRPELWPILETGERRSQMEWYVGISPTDRPHREMILTRIRSIASNLPIDGLFLDFVRWPLHWEMELRPGQPRPPDSSFDAATLEKFWAASGLKPPAEAQSAAECAAWIRERHFREWVDFKCEVVTSFIREARDALKTARPEAGLGVYAVPEVDGLTEPLTGQRIRDIATLVDWVSPMLYHNILLRPPNWIGQSLADILPVIGRKGLPVLQVDSNRDPSVAADWGPPMSLADWRAALAETDPYPGIAGLVVFPGTSLGPDRGEALKQAVADWQ